MPIESICVTSIADPSRPAFVIRKEDFNVLKHILSNNCVEATDLRTELDKPSTPSPADALTQAQVDTLLSGGGTLPIATDTVLGGIKAGTATVPSNPIPVYVNPTTGGASVETPEGITGETLSGDLQATIGKWVSNGELLYTATIYIEVTDTNGEGFHYHLDDRIDPVVGITAIIYDTVTETSKFAYVGKIANGQASWILLN